MYKKIMQTLLLQVLFFQTACADNIPISEAKLQGFKVLYEALNVENITILDGIDEGDTYFLKLQYKKLTKQKILYAFIDKKSAKVYIGTRYEKDGTASVFPKTKRAKEKIKQGVFFTFGKGEKEIYMVTDPSCPYCKKFEKMTKGKLSNYTIHVIFQVFSFHKKSPAMVEWIMQGKDDNAKQARMEAVMVDGSKKYESLLSTKRSVAIEEQIAKGIKAAQMLEAMGAPMFYDKDFNRLSKESIINSTKTKKP